MRSVKLFDDKLVARRTQSGGKWVPEKRADAAPSLRGQREKRVREKDAPGNGR
jgi:hypothetical protein